MPGGEEEISELIEKKEEARKKMAAENPKDPLPVLPETRKLAKIFGVPVPKSWEEVGEQFHVSASYAKAGITPDSAWAAKVRQVLPMGGLRYTRVRPHICELTPDEFALAQGFFDPVMKLRLLKDRYEMCKERVSGEVLELYLQGDPTSTDEVLSQGFISFWKKEYGDEEAVTRLMRVGYDEDKARTMVGLKPKPVEKPAEKRVSELTVEELEEEIRRRMGK